MIKRTGLEIFRISTADLEDFFSNTEGKKIVQRDVISYGKIFNRDKITHLKLHEHIYF